MASSPQLPAGWRSTALRDIASASSGGTPSRSVGAFYGGTIPWVKSGELNQDVISNTDEGITEEGLRNSSAKWVPRGTPLVAMYGATAGRCAWLDLDATVNQAVLAIRPDTSVADSRFLFHWLRATTPELLSVVQGSGQGNLSAELILGRRIDLPPLPEQRRIAEILTAVDDAIEATRTVIDQTRRLKTALLQDLLTHGLPEHRTGSRLVRFVGYVPTEWRVVPLGQVTQISNGTTPSRTVPAYWRGGIPWLPTGKVNDGEIRSADEFTTRKALRDCPLRLLPPGTTLIAMIGQGQTRGRAAYLHIEATINQNFAGVVPGPELVPRFLYHYLAGQYGRLRRSGRGSNQDALNCEVLRAFPVALPPLDHQERAVEVLDSLDLRIRAGGRGARQLAELKAALSQGLLTGRVPMRTGEND